METEILKCLKTLFNHSDGAQDAIDNNSSMSPIAASLASPQIPTRKAATDLLMFFVGRDSPKGFNLVLKALDDLAHSRRALGRFDIWFKSWEEAIDGRGKMGSTVGASETVMSLKGPAAREATKEFVNAQMNISMGYLDSQLSEYAVRILQLEVDTMCKANFFGNS